MSEKIFKIYSIKNYNDADTKFINNDGITFTNIKKITSELTKDKFYNFRVIPENQYIFYGDLDKYIDNFFEFVVIFQSFLNKYYNLHVETDEIKYTKNNKKCGSFHYSIPKWFCTAIKLKEIHENFNKIHPTFKPHVDTSVYTKHWYRCPNQSKGKGKEKIYSGDNQHVIINGTINDFVIDYIPSTSIDISNNVFCGDMIAVKDELQEKKPKKKIMVKKIETTNNTDIQIKEPSNQITTYNNELILSRTLGESALYKKLFDECYKPERFEQYEYWKNIGMAIKNTFNDENQAFELFNYYSSKGSNYEGFEKTRYKFTSFERKDADGYTIKTIHFYAIEDNKSKFIEIMNKNTFELGQTDMCKYLKTLVGYKFIYKKNGSTYKLYCYNGKYWENDDILLKNCISTVLYDFLKMILIEVYWNCKDFGLLKSKIEKLKLIGYKKDIVETYKEYGVNNEIMFDEKWWLFGFTNCVYDMKEQKFRDYYYDDNISITCGFDWREPTKEELKIVNDLIISIMPVREEREAYLDILCTAIDGRCLEKFIIFNGCGGNGKGVMNDLMLIALGNYGLLGNNGILFETSKTGSNPEKANMHKKRYVVFREPPEKNKFENSIIKELTGGGSFSARGHHETDTEKELNLTMVVECNKRPIFNEEPKEADVRRIVDMLFRSTFVTDKTQLDESKYVYYANSMYKTKEFQQKHKYALLKILMDRHIVYLQNESIIQLPPTVIERTNLYLELSCNIVQWFKNNYIETNDNKDVVKIKDVFDEFTDSDYFFNLSKLERRKYNKSFFVDYFETNIFLRKFYKERHNNVRNVLLGWTKIKDDQDE